jgi:hypothetical protein
MSIRRKGMLGSVLEGLEGEEEKVENEKLSIVTVLSITHHKN